MNRNSVWQLSVVILLALVVVFQAALVGFAFAWEYRYRVYVEATRQEVYDRLRN